MNQINEFIKENGFSKIVIFTDENILSLYPHFFDFIDNGKKEFMVLPRGEAAKSLEVYEDVCRQMLEKNIDRKALIINWGGGAVSDFGGFVASTYKRGCKMVNIPTTLLAMIDAAIGGKNALNVGGVKNAVGTFYLPDKVATEPSFLKTLSQNELLNGFGELLKYALISNGELWEELKNHESVSAEGIKKEWIDYCQNYKESLVKKDFYDNGERHLLNFGHTVGHALEAFFSPALSHGHAVALGCVISAYISYNKNLISKKDFQEIHYFVRKHYSFVSLDDKKIDEIVRLCRNDKKNDGGNLKFILLSEIGKAFETSVSEAELRVALETILVK